MFTSRTQRMLKPLRRTRDEIEEVVRERPKSTIGGALAVVAIVAIGIWAWPEIHRTIRIHRM